MAAIQVGDYAMEAIAFQKDDFPIQAETIIGSILDIYSQNSEKTEAGNKRIKTYVEDFNRLCFKRFGLKIDLRLDDDYLNASVYPPFTLFPHSLNNFDPDDYINDSNLPKITRWVLNRDRNLIGKTGTVDLKRARVTGAFSEITIPVYFGLSGLNALGINRRQLTAIIVHEIGHAFTWIELSNRMEKSNQVLADLGTCIKENKSYEERVYHIKEIAKYYELSDKERDELMSTESNTVLGWRLSKALIGSMKSQLGNVKYSETSSEQLADNFAVRFGMGRALIEGLEIIGDIFKPVTIMDLFLYISWMQLNLILTVIATQPIAAIILLKVVAYSILFIGIITIMVGFAVGGSNNLDYTYDNNRIRFTRIKHQIIQSLKEGIYTKKETKILLEDLEVIDRSIAAAKPYASVFTKIKDYFMESHRNTKTDIELQQLLEEIVHNPLFVKYAQLETVGEL